MRIDTEIRAFSHGRVSEKEIAAMGANREFLLQEKVDFLLGMRVATMALTREPEDVTAADIIWLFSQPERAVYTEAYSIGKEAIAKLVEPAEVRGMAA